METKANHLAVGAFVLLAIAGLTAFVLWLGKAEIDREVDLYHIYFTGSVSGLTTSSTVRYRGVPVGTVTEIIIDPDNSEQVRVTIEVVGGTPIKEDAAASLELQGITGLVDVQISGGAKESPRLTAKVGETLPVIASEASKIEELFENVPRAIARFTHLVERVALLLSDENMDAIHDTLQSVQRLGDALAKSSDEIEALTRNVAATIAELRRTAEEINLLIADLRTRVPALVDTTSAALNAAQDAFTSVSDNVDTLTNEAKVTLGQMRENAATLTGETRLTLREVRENVATLTDETQLTLRGVRENAATLTGETQLTLREVRENVATLTGETQLTLRGVRESAETLVGEAQPTLRQFRESAETLTTEVRLTLREMRENAKTLTSEAQPTLRQLRDSAETLTAEAQPAIREFRDNAARLTEEGLLTLREIRAATDALGGEARLTLREARGGAAELTDEARKALIEIGETARSLSDTAKQLSLIVSENREAFRDFSNEGLYELSRFLVESRALVGSLTRVMDRFEADPARFLFGDAQAGFEAQ